MTNKEAELEYVLTPHKATPIKQTPIKTKADVKYIDPPLDSDKQLSFYHEVVQNQSKVDKLKQLSKKNPFVPLGCLVTAGVLINGILALKRGDKVKSQRMMRYRVAAQGATILAFIGGALVSQYFV